MPTVHAGLLLKWAGRASSIQICLSPSAGMLEHHHPCLPRFPCQPLPFPWFGWRPVWSQGGRQRKGWLRTFSGCPGTCPPSTGALQARRTRNPGARPGCLFPITVPMLTSVHLLCCPPSLGRGAAGFLCLHTCSCAAACRPPWVCRAFGEAHVGAPALAWGRTGPHTVPQHLSFGFDLSPNPESSHTLFQIILRGGESSKNRCLCRVMVFGGG